MKSITLHKLDDELSERLAQAARRDGASLNRTAQRLLRKALGLDAPLRVDHRSDFTDLFGTWSKAEADRFHRRVRDLEEVDEDEW